MTSGRLVVWLTRHPMTVVVVCLAAIAVLAVLSASIVTLLRSPTATSTTTRAGPALTAPYTLPTPTQRPPQGRVDVAHRALHALDRACKTPTANRSGEAVRRPLDQIESFATAFPSGGFDIDGEPGTTLALLIVVWDQLKSCAPSYVPEVQELIPAQYRGG